MSLFLSSHNILRRGFFDFCAVSVPLYIAPNLKIVKVFVFLADCCLWFGASIPARGL